MLSMPYQEPQHFSYQALVNCPDVPLAYEDSQVFNTNSQVYKIYTFILSKRNCKHASLQGKFNSYIILQIVGYEHE